EPNPDVQDLLRASSGLNLGHRYLPGSFAYNVLIQPPPPPDEASAIVWFDAYVTNVDRTSRNVNMLLALGKLWLIDHGAALYFHHNWGDVAARALNTFPLVREHALLRFASRVSELDGLLRGILDDATLEAVVGSVPEVWLAADSTLGSPEDQRAAYLTFLRARRDSSAHFVQEAVHARATAGF
ncbi:MAG: HipA family kinase, partial [Caldilineaceae bacterium]